MNFNLELGNYYVNTEQSIVYDRSSVMDGSYNPEASAAVHGRRGSRQTGPIPATSAAGGHSGTGAASGHQGGVAPSAARQAGQCIADALEAYKTFCVAPRPASPSTNATPPLPTTPRSVHANAAVSGPLSAELTPNRSLSPSLAALPPLPPVTATATTTTAPAAGAAVRSNQSGPFKGVGSSLFLSSGSFAPHHSHSHAQLHQQPSSGSAGGSGGGALADPRRASLSVPAYVPAGLQAATANGMATSYGGITNNSGSSGSDVVVPTLPDMLAFVAVVRRMSHDQLMTHAMRTHELLLRMSEAAAAVFSSHAEFASIAASGSSASIKNSSVQSSFMAGSLAVSGAAGGSWALHPQASSLSLGHQRSIASIMSMRRHSVRTTNHLSKSVDDDGMKTINDYIVLDNLGRGAHGKVKLAYCPIRCCPVAIKIVRRTHIKGGEKIRDECMNEALQREIAVMKKLRHKNIVSLFEVIDDPSADKLYLVMQYVEGGSLRSLSSEGTCDPVDPEALALAVRQVCAGLKYLHDRKIVHRDIKPENVLKNPDGTVYLADFGVSEIAEAEALGAAACGGLVTGRQKGLAVHGHSGTLNFLAPELFTGDSSADGEAVDIWALGVTCFTLLTGRQPFFGVNEIRDAPLPPLPENVKNSFSGEWAALVEAMLTRDVRRRIRLTELRKRIKAMVPLDLSYSQSTNPVANLGASGRRPTDPTSPTTPSTATAAAESPSAGANASSAASPTNAIPKLVVELSDIDIRSAVTRIHASSFAAPDVEEIERTFSAAGFPISPNRARQLQHYQQPFHLEQHHQHHQQLPELAPELELDDDNAAFEMHFASALGGTMPPEPKVPRAAEYPTSRSHSSNGTATTAAGGGGGGGGGGGIYDSYQHDAPRRSSNATTVAAAEELRGSSSSAFAAMLAQQQQQPAVTTAAPPRTGSPGGGNARRATSRPEDAAVDSYGSKQPQQPRRESSPQPIGPEMTVAYLTAQTSGSLLMPERQDTGLPALVVGGDSRGSFTSQGSTRSRDTADVTLTPNTAAGNFEGNDHAADESPHPRPLQQQQQQQQLQQSSPQSSSPTNIDTSGVTLARRESVKARRKLEELLQMAASDPTTSTTTAEDNDAGSGKRSGGSSMTSAAAAGSPYQVAQPLGLRRGNSPQSFNGVV